MHKKCISGWSVVKSLVDFAKVSQINLVVILRISKVHKGKYKPSLSNVTFIPQMINLGLRLHLRSELKVSIIARVSSTESIY